MSQNDGGRQPVGGLAIHKVSADQVRRLHEATLEVLERVGVRLFDDEALALMAGAGASVADGNKVRIPARLVEQAMAWAPKKVTLYDRTGQAAIVLDGYRSYFGPGSDCLNIVDHRTGQRRKAVLQDVVDGITVCDALSHLDFAMSMYMPCDVDGRIADRYQMEIMLGHTTKPIVFINYDFEGCVDAIEMAEIVAGSPDALRERPFVTGYVNTTTGLRHNQESLQKILYLAGKGLPCVVVAGASAGLTTPVTVPGAMIVRNAGSLAALVLSQLKNPGTPLIVAGSVDGSLDMRTMILPYAEPEPRGMAEALVHSYGLPQFTTGGVSDAHVPDEQAGIEAALTILVDALAGGHLVHDVGYLDQAMCGSLPHLVVCDEIISWVRSFMSELEIADETLAIDLIDQVGPDGQFLDTDHTLRHYKDRWYPAVFDRDNYERWAADGSQTLIERAAGCVDKILAGHRPAPLSAGVSDGIHAIVERAERRLEGARV